MNSNSNKKRQEGEKLPPFYPKNKTPIVKFEIERLHEEVKHKDISARLIIEYDPEWHLVRFTQEGWDGVETEGSFYPREIKKIATLLLSMDRILKEEVNLNNVE